jgi:hypothetical protein
MADGKSGTGPTRFDATPDANDEGGMGAGGAVQVHVNELTGRGHIHADGGSQCLLKAHVLPGVHLCDVATGGGGGGGRVLVRARRHSAWKGTVTARGGFNETTPAPGQRGAPGTVRGLR